MSGILTELFPYMYHTGRNELIGYIECLEPELDYIRDRYKGLTALIDVNTCPEDYLPYLAAMINCPLIGNDPRKWRGQIKAWPTILRMKGTEASVVTLLEKVGLTQVHVDTYWRDGGGNYTTERPTGAPVYDAGAGVWLNSRTHYFTLALSTPSGELLSTEDMENIRRLLAYVKPYHAEILEYQLYGRFADASTPEESITTEHVHIPADKYPWTDTVYGSGLLYSEVMNQLYGGNHHYGDIGFSYAMSPFSYLAYGGETKYGDTGAVYGLTAHEVPQYGVFRHTEKMGFEIQNSMTDTVPDTEDGVSVYITRELYYDNTVLYGTQYQGSEVYYI